jgi:YD repeat-containing protein
LGADFGATRITSRYDERGNKIEAAYFGTDGQMILRKDIGVARLTWHYDERGGVVEEAYFGTDGQTILRKDIGAAVLTWRYDERGDRIEQAYFGTNGQPILRKDIGVARETWRYDERGNAIEEAYFGADGQPILRKDSGAARTTWRYDERRNEVEQTFFGGDGKPILSRDFAAARVIRTYDEAATLVESETFDVAGLELRDWFAGDDEQKRGDYVAALARYTAGLTRIARGATQEPTNIRGQLALADIHDRIANTRQAMNDRAGAAQSLTAETEILLALTQHQLDATSRDDVTERLGNHSYVLLFIGEDKKALDTADVAIALAPDKRWILTNKAHALMFLDQTEAARALYLAPDNRGREMPDGNTWEADITNDFAELRKAGRTNPLMDEVLRAFVAPPPSETAPP